MSEHDTTKKSGNLDYTLATFVYLLHDEEHRCTVKEVEEACSAMKMAANKAQIARVAETIGGLLSNSFGSGLEQQVIEKFIESNYFPDSGSSSPKELASALVDALGASLQEGEDLQSWISSKYPETRFIFGFSGNTHNEQLANIRKHVFGRSRPWLAKIATRVDDQIELQWILVENFNEMVTCMDPYPWDDIDEEYTISIEEFMTRWKLAGEQTIAF
jgi:hypothetical protein